VPNSDFVWQSADPVEATPKDFDGLERELCGNDPVSQLANILTLDSSPPIQSLLLPETET
jgi:hypothetical protein